MEKIIFKKTLSVFLLIVLSFFYLFVNKSVNAQSSITSSTVSISSYTLSDEPCALNITYYDGICSRGFAWQTTVENDETKLWIVESNEGQNAIFNTEVINGSCEEATYDNQGRIVSNTYNATYSSASGKDSLTFNYHLVHVTDLDYGKTYSYKVGGEDNYKYGVFTVEEENAKEINVLNFNDAQTKKPELLYVWENTVAQAFNAFKSTDFVLFGGDQFDANMYSENTSTASSINRLLRYEAAKDTISSIIGSTPYMSTTGNHDPYLPYGQVITSDINWGGTNQSGGYYSFDYDYAHFVVLDSNLSGESFDTQKNWLISDLSENDAIWIVVMLHNGPYATGDHSNGANTQKIVTELTPVFAQYHVDLVLQGHDHTYSKTLPYLWGENKGYTTIDNDTSIVNYNVLKNEYNGITYDVNSNGTYYVSCGSAGHRVGEAEADAGLWSDLVKDGNNISGATSVSFLNNTYKIAVGEINYNNTYASYTFSGKASGTSTVVSYTNDGIYNVGDPSSANVNAQMFGALTITEKTLVYKFYTVEGSEVKLFDSLNVMKISDEESQIMNQQEGNENSNSIKALFNLIINKISKLADFVVEKLRQLIDSISSSLEADRETKIDAVTSTYSSVKPQLQSIQSSMAVNNAFNLRLIAGTEISKDDCNNVGFKIYKWNGTSYGEENKFICDEVYTTKVETDIENGFANEKTVASMNGGKLFALTINDISSIGTIKLLVIPYGESTNEKNELVGQPFEIEITDGFIINITAVEVE